MAYHPSVEVPTVRTSGAPRSLFELTTHLLRISKERRHLPPLKLLLL